MNNRQKIVFCDFDGTITVKDGFVGVCERFAPEKVNALMPGVMTREISLRQGITEIVESIPSSAYPEMLTFVEGAEIRPGFADFLALLARNEIDFVVISGGLKGLVEVQLAAYLDDVSAIYAADVKTDTPCLTIVSAFQSGPELVAKALVMAQYPYETAVAIGDGVTDYKMSQKADIVFARGHLAKHMAATHRSFHPWSDFYEVAEKLKTIWELK